MTMHTKAEWEAIEPKLARHTYIVLHHTTGPAHQAIAEIDDEHKRQGWAGVGYHRVVNDDGQIMTGRPDDVMGAQAKGLNAYSVGVAVTGNYMTHLPGRAQWDGMIHCLAVECARWNVPVERIIGHRDVARIVNDPSVATACPGNALYAELPRIRRGVAAEMATMVR